MAILRWLVIALASLEAGWMVFDGSRALTVGDYVTPKSGAYAGQLRPWTKLVSAVGIDPRSTQMKMIFVCYGLIWLVIIASFIMRLSWSPWAMLIAAAGALWFLSFGTISSVIQIVLLLILLRSNAL